MLPPPNRVTPGTSLSVSGSLHQRDVQIRAVEIFAHEEERLSGELGGGVGEAIAVVQRGWMSSTAEAQKGLSGFATVRCSEGQDDEIEIFYQAREDGPANGYDTGVGVAMGHKHDLCVSAIVSDPVEDFNIWIGRYDVSTFFADGFESGYTTAWSGTTQ